MSMFRRLALAAGVAALLTGAPSMSHATSNLSPACKELLALIVHRIAQLEQMKKAHEISGEYFFVELVRLKKLAWTAVYVQYASTETTCEDLIKYVSHDVSKYTLH